MRNDETTKKQNTTIDNETTAKSITDGFKRETDDDHFISSRNDVSTNTIRKNSLNEQIELLKKHDEEQKNKSIN